MAAATAASICASLNALRHISLEDGHFELLGIRQVLPSGGFVLRNGVPALLQHLVDDCQHIGIGQLADVHRLRVA